MGDGPHGKTDFCRPTNSNAGHASALRTSPLSAMASVNALDGDRDGGGG